MDVRELKQNIINVLRRNDTPENVIVEFEKLPENLFTNKQTLKEYFKGSRLLMKIVPLQCLNDVADFINKKDPYLTNSIQLAKEMDLMGNIHNTVGLARLLHNKITLENAFNKSKEEIYKLIDKYNYAEDIRETLYELEKLKEKLVMELRQSEN